MESNRVGILKFNLETLEGRNAHIRATKADDAYRALHEITTYLLRKWRKYGIPEEHLAADPQELVRIMEQEIHNIIQECGLNLGEEYE